MDNVHTLRGCTASSGYSSDGGGRDGASSSGWSFSLSGIVSGVQNVFTLLAVLLFMYRLRQHMRLGLFGAGGGAGNHHGGRPTSASGLRRRPSGSGTRNLGMVHRTSTGQLSTAGLLHTTSNGRISDGAVPGTPPPMDTLDLADGTHVVSTEDAQRHAADVTPMAEDQSRCCVCHKKFKTIKYGLCAVYGWLCRGFANLLIAVHPCQVSSKAPLQCVSSQVLQWPWLHPTHALLKLHCAQLLHLQAVPAQMMMLLLLRACMHPFAERWRVAATVWVEKGPKNISRGEWMNY